MGKAWIKKAFHKLPKVEGADKDSQRVCDLSVEGGFTYVYLSPTEGVTDAATGGLFALRVRDSARGAVDALAQQCEDGGVMVKGRITREIPGKFSGTDMDNINNELWCRKVLDEWVNLEFGGHW